MRRYVLGLLGLVILATPLAAFARNTEVVLPVAGAVASDVDRHLTDVAFYMKGGEHPSVAQKFAVVSASRSTRGVFRSDEASCRIAFLSAMRALQARASQEGGNAIIDVISITRGETTESPTDFRCVAGTTIVHVGLKGTIVRLE